MKFGTYSPIRSQTVIAAKQFADGAARIMLTKFMGREPDLYRFEVRTKDKLGFDAVGPLMWSMPTPAEFEAYYNSWGWK